MQAAQLRPHLVAESESNDSNLVENEDGPFNLKSNRIPVISDRVRLAMISLKDYDPYPKETLMRFVLT